MKNSFAFLLLYILFLSITSNANAQTDVTDNGINISLTSNTIFFVPGSIKIFGAGSVLNNGNFYLGGDFINNGDGLNALGTGVVIFNGAGNQNISGTNSTNFYDVIKSTGSSVIIALDETIKNRLTLTTGFFDITITL